MLTERQWKLLEEEDKWDLKALHEKKDPDVLALLRLGYLKIEDVEWQGFYSETIEKTSKAYLELNIRRKKANG